MLSFQQDFPGTTLIKLEQNYRSTQVILDAANGIIAENARRLGKTLFTAQQGGEPVTLLTAADERDEAEWLAGELSRRAADGDMAYEGMAILYRTNAQSRPLEEAFRFRGIPYRLVGAVSFYERREVKDVLAYLRLIANPADDEAFARIVNVPRRGIGDASFAPLVRAATQWGKPLLETARAAERIPDLRPNVRAAFTGVAALIDDLRARHGQADPATALEQVVAAVGERAGGARGGATAVLRGTHARARKIVSLMGAHAVPHRAPRAVGAIALPRGLAGGRARRAEHDAAVGPRRARHARRGARWSGAAPGAGGAGLGGRGVAGRAALRDR